MGGSRPNPGRNGLGGSMTWRRHSMDRRHVIEDILWIAGYLSCRRRGTSSRASACSSMIREHGLEWTREGRSSGESILSPASHLKLARHNYNDVR